MTNILVFILGLILFVWPTLYMSHYVPNQKIITFIDAIEVTFVWLCYLAFVCLGVVIMIKAVQ